MSDLPTLPPPEPVPCWAGRWTAPGGHAELWLHAAVLRTVNALPRLHPWRLGEERGGSRVLQWAGRLQPLPAGPAAGPAAGPVPEADGSVPEAYGVLTVSAREPNLPTGDAPQPAAGVCARGAVQALGSAVGWAAGWASGELRAAAGDVLADPRKAPRWAGAVARLPGCWLPPLAVLPRAARGLDDPGTTWPTESADFAARHSVYAEDSRYAADVLAPHVMALVLDRVPRDAAVTLAGDALHVWWAYPPTSSGLVVAETVAATSALAGALPSFLAADHPDRSAQVEQGLAARARAGEEYRRARRPGRSADPLLQAMYDRARADHGLDGVAGSSA